MTGKLDAATLRAVVRRWKPSRYNAPLLVESALLRQDYAAALGYQVMGRAFAAFEADLQKLLATMLKEAKQSATRKPRARKR